MSNEEKIVPYKELLKKGPYIVLEEKDITQLSEVVSHQMKTYGFKPIGGVVYRERDAGLAPSLLQAMVK